MRAVGRGAAAPALRHGPAVATAVLREVPSAGSGASRQGEASQRARPWLLPCTLGLAAGVAFGGCSGRAAGSRRALGGATLVGCVGGPTAALQRKAVARAAGRALPDEAAPAPLCAVDGLKEGAPAEDVFTWDTITKRMPSIMDSVIAVLPASLKDNKGLLDGIRALQKEMAEGAPLKPLDSDDPWVGAPAWNEHLSEFIERGEGWHHAPWWVVENYMYKRLLQELARCGPEGKGYDPFTPIKAEAMAAAEGALPDSVRPLLGVVAAAEAQPEGHADRRSALEAALFRSLWGNQADLSLSAGKVTSSSGGGAEKMLSDHTATALDLLQNAGAKPVIVVLDNHGLEVLCDLVLVDAVIRLTGARVCLHVKDSPVFVSDVTEGDVPGILDWLQGCEPSLADRLRGFMADGRLTTKASAWYTSARSFWELPEELRQDFSGAATVILKGDANYRRLLGDLHWPYATDYAKYVRSFWPPTGLICLRTLKSGVAIGIEQKEQDRAKAEDKAWLTNGKFAQVLAVDCA